MNKTENQIVKKIFCDMENGVFPNFGSPETKCDKCMFYGIACCPAPEYVGCLGGWKREEE